MTRVITRLRVQDADVQAALEEHARTVGDVGRDPILSRRTISVTLPDATLVKIKHGLGKRFENYILSAPQGATTSGRIVESTATDPSKEVWLTATGYGATIKMRMTVWAI